jgi:hypothetical protein
MRPLYGPEWPGPKRKRIVLRHDSKIDLCLLLMALNCKSIV